MIFLEPKALYRAAVEDVPTGEYEVPLGVAKVVIPGRDVTVVGWGGQMVTLHKAVAMAEALGISCELIDLRSLLPWDVETVTASVARTGRLVVSHEAPITGGFAAEIAATVQGECFLSLEAPVQRVCGYDTPFPLAFEKHYIPDAYKVLEAIKLCVNY